MLAMASVAVRRHAVDRSLGPQYTALTWKRSSGTVRVVLLLLLGLGRKRGGLLLEAFGWGRYAAEQDDDRRLITKATRKLRSLKEVCIVWDENSLAWNKEKGELYSTSPHEHARYPWCRVSTNTPTRTHETGDMRAICASHSRADPRLPQHVPGRPRAITGLYCLDWWW